MLVKHAGPRPAANIVNGLLAAGRKDNTGKPVVLLGGGATCGNAVGREIERTTSELWREGVPLIGAEKTHRRGEIHVDVWHLKGGGYITLASRGDRPATLITTSDANCEVLYAASFLQPIYKPERRERPPHHPPLFGTYEKPLFMTVFGLLSAWILWTFSAPRAFSSRA